MNPIKLIHWSVVLIVCLFFNLPAAFAGNNNRDSLPAGIHLSLLERSIQEANFLSFNLSMITRQPGQVPDTLSGQYKLNKNKYHVQLGNIVSMQNDRFSMTLYPADKIMMIAKSRSTYAKVMQVDLLDSLVQKGYITGMTVTDTATYHKLTVTFNDRGPYVSYSIVYNLQQGVPLLVKYTLRNFNENGVRADQDIVITYNNFQYGQFTDSVFSTDPFFSWQGGRAQMTPAYSDYTLFDHSAGY